MIEKDTMDERNLFYIGNTLRIFDVPLTNGFLQLIIDLHEKHIWKNKHECKEIEAIK